MQTISRTHNDTIGSYGNFPRFFASTRQLVSALAVAALCGCSTGGLHPQSSVFRADDLQVDRTYADVDLSAAQWPKANWWTAFGDTQLDALVSEALADSPSLRIAEARVRQAQAMEAAAGAPLLPQVSGTFSSIEHRYSANGVTPHPVAGTWQLVNEGSLNLGYELDFWGKNRATLDAAIGRSKAAEIDGEAARVTIASAIVQAYISLQASYDLKAIQQDLLDQQEAILDLTHRRAKAQLGSQIDIEQAQAAIPAARAQIAALNEQIDLGRNRLAALLGKGPDRGKEITRPGMRHDDAFSIPSTLPSDLLGHRPDVVAQRWRVEAAAHEIKAAKARFYPSFNLSAFVGLQSLGFDAFTDSQSGIVGAGPAISLPIFSGGRLRAGLAAQDAAYDIAVEGYNQTLTDALRDIADQLTGLTWLKTRMAEEEEAVATASRSAELVKHRYAAGLATYLQVLAAQNAVSQQRLQYSALTMRGLSLQGNLSRALGGGYAPGEGALSLINSPENENSK